ncbi:MAG: tetratricopeptide repeat protein, partial [Phycisphaerales bacterium]
MNRSSIIAAFFALPLLAGQNALAQSGYDLFQKGLVQERTEGDLDEAIRLYKQIIEDHKDDRALVAKTLVQMGGCYEKLGRAEAQKAYQRVIQEFADQLEPVTQARSRLAALGQREGEEGPILRRVYSGYVGYPGNLSHDGKLATITDWDTGDLAVRDLTSGEARRLTNKGSWSESNAFADQSIFSPDDKQIAYVWYTHERGSQLRIISIDGTGQRVLYPRNEENKKDDAFLWPIDWSLDRERILCTWHSKDYKNRAMLLSVGDGSLRELELPEREKLELEEDKPISNFHSAKFSPDGRHLTLDGRAAKDAGRDVFLLSLEDGSRTALVEHPADDYLLGWSPDDNYLVFASDRTGALGIWVLRVDQGKPVGKPMLVKTQMGNFGRIGMMRNGAYYFTTGSGERRNIFTASFDLQTGKVTPAPKALLPDGEFHRTAADWLGGADEIAYLEWGSKGEREIRKIMIHSLKTGATREVVTKPKIKGFNFNSLAVCPTGKWLAVWGYIEDGLKWAVLLIDLETNELTEIKHGNFVNIRWSKDGRWLYFGGFLPDENRNALFRRDMQTGKVTELFEPPSSFYSWKISPDEKQIAYSDWETDEIKVIPVTGGEPRVVAKVKDAKNGGSKFWTPDGRYLVYIDRGQLWRVAVEGGEPEAITISPRIRMSRIGHLQIHPGGQRILFSGQRHPSKYELWTLENFLPEKKVAHKPTFRKINIASKPQNGVLSPDGNKLAFMSDDAVWVVPLHGKVDPDIAGEPVRLAEVPGIWDASNLMAWSADGKWIAVYGQFTSNRPGGVRVIPVAGGKPRVVQLPKQGSGLLSYRLSLSPDGQILAFSALELGTRHGVPGSPDRYVYTIPTAGGEPKQVSSHWARMPSFSPDGQFIAYVGYRKREAWQRYREISRFHGDLWVVPSAGGTPVKLASVDGQLEGPVWSPDGKYIAAHNGSNEIWVFPLSPDASSAGEPEKIALPRSSWRNMLAGWTPDDELGVFISTEQQCAIYTVPASGGRAVQISPPGASPRYPRWSPDGERIYFRGRFDKEDKVPILYVPSEGGDPVQMPPVQLERRLVSRVPNGGHNVSPDGKRIVISTSNGIWTIPLDGGLPTRLTSGESFEGLYP